MRIYMHPGDDYNMGVGCITRSCECFLFFIYYSLRFILIFYFKDTLNAAGFQVLVESYQHKDGVVFLAFWRFEGLGILYFFGIPGLFTASNDRPSLHTFMFFSQSELKWLSMHYRFYNMQYLFSMGLIINIYIYIYLLWPIKQPYRKSFVSYAR